MAADSNAKPSQYNLAQVNEAIVGAVGARTAIVFGRRRFSYVELGNRSRQLARVLRARSVGVQRTHRTARGPHESHQDHVAIFATNGNEYLETMLGAFKAGAVPLNINYRYVADELRYVLVDCAAKAIVFQSAFASTVEEVLPGLPEPPVLLQIDDGSGADLLSRAEWYEPALASATNAPLEWAKEWSPDDLYILYTGGTTGAPKAVLWRQGDIHRASLGGRNPATRETWPTIEGLVSFAVNDPSPNIVLPSSPFMHGAGHWTALQALNLGGTVVIQDDVNRLNAANICSVIERERVTYLQVVGDTFCRPIADEIDAGTHDLSSLRTIRTGGTGLSMTLKRRLLDRLPGVTLMDSMGSSEGGGQGIQFMRAHDVSEPTGFTPVEGSAILSANRERVLRPDENETGWLAKKGDIAMGYLGDLKKTLETFQMIAGDRYSVPGDRARWLADGTIELLGRDSATINSGGEKIFAEEVEEAILHHPDVQDVLVASRPSERWGQEVVAVVALRANATASKADLSAEAGRHIARFKLPKEWIFVDTVVRLPAGKPDRRWAARVAASTKSPE